MSNRRGRLLATFLTAVILSLTLYLGQVTFVNANTTTTIGGTTGAGLPSTGFQYAYPITLPSDASGPLQSIGIHWAGTESGNVRVALYSAGSGKPANLLAESASMAMSGGWQDIATSTNPDVAATTYWVAIQIDSSRSVYYNLGSRSYYAKTYAAFDPTWSASSSQDSSAQWNMRVTYGEGAIPPPGVIHPTGPVRIWLRSIGNGKATWWGKAPWVFDGSFSAQLTSGTGGGANGGGIYIGPLDIPLSSLTESQITFWVYHQTGFSRCEGPVPENECHPYVNIVLDNGRKIEGVTSVAVTGATIKYEDDQNYPSADIWVQMQPTGAPLGGGGGWYTSYPDDPVLHPVKLCTNSVGGCTLDTWKAAFPTARVIQIQIQFGLWTGSDQTVYIDSVKIGTLVVPIEPETGGF